MVQHEATGKLGPRLWQPALQGQEVVFNYRVSRCSDAWAGRWGALSPEGKPPGSFRGLDWVYSLSGLPLNSVSPRPST